MCVCARVYSQQKAPPSENPHVFRNGTNEKRESTRHRITCTHAHANNLLTLQFSVWRCCCWWCFVIFFALLGFFLATSARYRHQEPLKKKLKERVWGGKTSAGNWRVFKWKFTLNLKYLVNERVLFACLLLYITIFMYWIPSKWRLIKREDRVSEWASKQTNKYKGKKGRGRGRVRVRLRWGREDERIVKQNL